MKCNKMAAHPTVALVNGRLWWTKEVDNTQLRRLSLPGDKN